MTQTEDIIYHVEDNIATITMNRPKKLNAIDDDMVRAIMAAMDRFDMDDEAHTAILCGNGRAFCSGADVRARQLRSQEDLRSKGGPSAKDAKSGDIFLRSVNWKPVIAAVHGYVLGLGLGMVLAMNRTNGTAEASIGFTGADITTHTIATGDLDIAATDTQAITATITLSVETVAKVRLKSLTETSGRASRRISTAPPAFPPKY